jgi:hypothetical protein
MSLLGGTAQAAATSPQAQQAAGQAAQSQGLSPQIIQQEVAKLMGGGQQGSPSLVAAIGDYLRGPRTPQDRQQLVQTITQTTGKSEAEANQMIDNLERQVQGAKETGEQAANITGATFIALAISMLLGAVAAALGSLLAAAPPAVTPREYGRTPTARATVGTYTER